jgi:hypothetical protein
MKYLEGLIIVLLNVAFSTASNAKLVVNHELKGMRKEVVPVLRTIQVFA